MLAIFDSLMTIEEINRNRPEISKLKNKYQKISWHIHIWMGVCVEAVADKVNISEYQNKFGYLSVQSYNYPSSDSSSPLVAVVTCCLLRYWKR